MLFDKSADHKNAIYPDLLTLYTFSDFRSLKNFSGDLNTDNFWFLFLKVLYLDMPVYSKNHNQWMCSQVCPATEHVV